MSVKTTATLMAVVTAANLSSPRCKAWGAAKRGRGKASNTPPPAFRVRLPWRTRASLARAVQERGEEAGETRTAIAEALQAGRWGRGVGGWESPIHGEGPQGEGRETGQRSPGNAHAVPHGLGGILATWTSPYM